MQVKISDLRKVFELSLTKRGLSKAEAKMVAEPFVEAQLSGKKTHGIGKFLLIDEAIKKREGKPEIIKDKFNYVQIDAHKELGYISAQFATDVLIKKARKYGNAIVAVKNSYYYSMLGIYARKVAKAGFYTIILNGGGPAAVVPYGGAEPIFGTNPISIGIPTDNEPIIVDMATSEKPWGEINLAKIEKRKLQKNTFIDSKGKFTTNPDDVAAIVPFGGHKGYGINLGFEVITGALVGTKMGLQTQNGYDLGFFFLAFSPSMFTSKQEFNRKMSILVKEIKHSRKMQGVNEIYLPGEQASKKLAKAIKSEKIEIEQKTWEKLLIFSKGGNVKAQLNLKE